MHAQLNRGAIIMTVVVPVSCIVLFMVRHHAVFGSWGTHLSNFTLSLLLVFGLGSAVVAAQKPFIIVRLFAIVLIAANVLVESFVTFMNTPDMADALLGIAGTLVAYGLVETLRIYGIKNRVL